MNSMDYTQVFLVLLLLAIPLIQKTYSKRSFQKWRKLAKSQARKLRYKIALFLVGDFARKFKLRLKEKQRQTREHDTDSSENLCMHESTRYMLLDLGDKLHKELEEVKSEMEKYETDQLEASYQVYMAQKAGLNFVSLVAKGIVTKDEEKDEYSVLWKGLLAPVCSETYFVMSEDGKSITVKQGGYYEVSLTLAMFGRALDNSPALMRVCINDIAAVETSIESSLYNYSYNARLLENLKLESWETITVKAKARGVDIKNCRVRVSYLGSD